MSSSLSIDKLLGELAARYDGLIPTAAVRAAGHSQAALARRIDIDTLVRVRSGVVARAGTELTPIRRAMASAMVSADSWLSHTTALKIHGATMRSGAVHAEISSPHQLRLCGVRTHRSSPPGIANLGSHFDVPIARPWWAIVESASVLNDDDLAVAMDSLIQLKLLSLKRLQQAHDKAGWYRGRAILDQLLHDRLNGYGMVRSFFEQDLSKLLVRHGLPMPIRNYRLELPNGTKREIDAAWPDVRVGAEAHSWQYHSNTSDWGRTMVRDRGLTASGWTIVPVVVADIRNPASLLNDLRSLLVTAPTRRQRAASAQTNSANSGLGLE